MSSLSPAIFSGAPHSSTLMWADSAAITAPQRGSRACRATTLAPVPLKTGYASARSPKCLRNTSWRCSVYWSSPYATWCPPLATARAARISGCTPA
ncbi:hypothetical protein ASE03_14150 [Kitasatospora sp. Root187]|nr:hypothetical protein ASE03_14150 [Kitasatospora sp. Root187]